jgi:SM-20-related protein
MNRFRHCVIDGFLPDADQQALLDFAFNHEGNFRPSKIRRSGEGQLVPEERRSSLCRAPLEAIKARFVDAVGAEKERLFKETGTRPFEIFRFEVELAAHRDGSFFAPHQDTFTGPEQQGTVSDRIVSLVYYFHALPKHFNGGELAIFPVSEGEAEPVEPCNNRLVAFPSIAFHEVRIVHVPGDAFQDCRFAINCWLHRKR